MRVAYERPDGSIGVMWEHDWLRIMKALYEATRGLYTAEIENGYKDQAAV
jgi:hypothetical protein